MDLLFLYMHRLHCVLDMLSCTYYCERKPALAITPHERLCLSTMPHPPAAETLLTLLNGGWSARDKQETVDDLFR